MERQSIVYTGSEGLSALSICLRKHNSVQYLSPPTKKPLVTHFSSPPPLCSHRDLYTALILEPPRAPRL